jgi:hypothetical protein
MQFAGLFSFVPALSVQVALVSQARKALSAASSAGREASQEGSQPLPGIRGCAPAPALGFDAG